MQSTNKWKNKTTNTECIMSYVLKVRIQQIECLPAQSTNQLHTQLQPHSHFQWLRHSVAAPLSEHATKQKKPGQRRLVTLVPQQTLMQCRPDSCTAAASGCCCSSFICSMNLFSWDCGVSQPVYAALVVKKSCLCNSLQSQFCKSFLY